MRIDSYLSPKCEVRDCSHGGKGVFARVAIEPMELVAIFSGPVVTTEELSRIPESDAPYSLSIHDGFHLGVAKINGEMDDTVYFNHSCKPNVGIKGQIVLLARRRISPSEELCFDYDTTEITPPPPHFQCFCGSADCRRIINGTSWQNPEFVARNAGWLAWNVEERILRGTHTSVNNREGL